MRHYNSSFFLFFVVIVFLISISSVNATNVTDDFLENPVETNSALDSMALDDKVITKNI
ncbi:hypothetical protein [Methanosphaera sp.]|uniref:hypothetical protein n=1 Tax=Methanosphaera sp. TaxID=2666342 RepID=UPI002E797644|nr:hypothetical protein [Methanosphaera sp.]MEE1118159.1 hypothetical protein [Methanosphaera sp.]